MLREYYLLRAPIDEAGEEFLKQFGEEVPISFGYSFNNGNYVLAPSNDGKTVLEVRGKDAGEWKSSFLEGRILPLRKDEVSSLLQ